MLLKNNEFLEIELNNDTQNLINLIIVYKQVCYVLITHQLSLTNVRVVRSSAFFKLKYFKYNQIKVFSFVSGESASSSPGGRVKIR